MLWRTLTFRRAPAGVADSDGLAAASPLMPPDESLSALIGAANDPAPASVPAGRRLLTRRRIFATLLVALLVTGGIAYSQRHAFTAQGADLCRRLIGDENTARLESWYFSVDDRLTKLKFRVLGGDTNPFETGRPRVDYIARPEPRAIPYYLGTEGNPPPALLSPDTLGPAPITLPQTRLLRDTAAPGEGQWTTAGLPRSSPNDVLMAKTFIHPDRTRPYATVAVLLMDARRIRLHMSGGTIDPGGDRGVKGPGTIPADQYAGLLVAINGGFKGPHGGFGMYADGKEYRPLRNGLASIAVMKDGSIKMGEWGKDLSWSENILAVRQNAVLLVQDGQVSPRTSEGNDTWGYVQVDSSEFITWRSAIGLTKDGNLLFAAGNSLSAEALARALWAAGAHTAMQLDINSPYVLISAFFAQPGGHPDAERFMDTMPDSPARFLKTQERDFFWVTLDETRYR